jgi:AcrR family transcriptional regulator
MPQYKSRQGAEPNADDHRSRLLNGMAAAIVEKGYSASTIADVVRHARVSKRTFYEHFADKEECYLALYEASSDRMMQVIAGVVSGSDLPAEERLEAAARAYLSGLAARPALTRTNLMEIQAAGPRALAARRQVLQRFADMLRRLIDDARREDPALRPLSPSMSMAIVGGMHELLLLAVEEGRAHQLEDLTETATELMRAVVSERPA